MRPGTSKRPPTGHPLPVGTATRLTTGMRQRGIANTSACGIANVTSQPPSTALNRELKVEDRTMTGAQGLRSTTAASTAQGWRGRRQVEDRGYFIGLLRTHVNAISSELTAIAAAHEESENEAKSYVQYEKMAEALAAELKALQGELGDYNTLVDKATLGHDMSSIELDWEDLKAANERTEISLERLFEERKKKEAQLQSLEKELEQEKQMSESVVEDMNDEQRKSYLRLKDLNEHLLQELSIGQGKLIQLSLRKSELEADICTSKIKQDAMRLMGQLRELEAKRDQLEAEEAQKEDPQVERERLLATVKENNRETANMEREIRELKEKIRSAESNIQQLTNEMNDDTSNERTQKILELQRREAQIEAFFASYESSHIEECEGLNTTEEHILKTLERCAQYIVSTEQTMELRSGENELTGGASGIEALTDQLSFKTKELGKSASTAEALQVERARLQKDLQKIDQLEGKITQELQTLKRNIALMEIDLKKFSDLKSVGEASEKKKIALTAELERLQETRQNLGLLTAEQTAKRTVIEGQLNSQETHLQLCALEKRLIATEQTRFALTESVKEKRAICDFTASANAASSLVNEYNEALKAALKVKPVGVMGA